VLSLVFAKIDELLQARHRNKLTSSYRSLVDGRNWPSPAFDSSLTYFRYRGIPDLRRQFKTDHNVPVGDTAE
jgi:hypothetical protein